MSQTFSRKLRVVLGAAVCASLGFGVVQVKASPALAEDSRLACTELQRECFCPETGFYCVNLPKECRVCIE